MHPRRRDLTLLLAAAVCGGAAPVSLCASFDVRRFGATGDGRTLDTIAVNRAIIAASAAGGGTVRFPAGTYACHSIRLKSNVTLQLQTGATILAADPPGPGSPSPGYDPAEPNPFDAFQDFGHGHWHNSLIWGEDLHDVAILGPGRIWGRGLVRQVWEPGQPPATQPGVANKAIALVRCRNVIIRDVSILRGGHFGILATGVDNLLIDGVAIDTDRDGMNADCCRNVRISNCTVNSPFDDAICLKSSLALGEPRPTENVTISDCALFGDYRVGTLLDGSFQSIGDEADADPGQRTGRIKLGTESVGDFRNIAISNCTFQSCRGLALETVDGGTLEDITITGVTMRDLRNSPIFLRLGSRLRAPAGVLPGRLRRVVISDIVCDSERTTMPSIISGIPGHPIEDVQISNVSMLQRGGVMLPALGLEPPEEVAAYPDPVRFAPLPAQGFFIRHASSLALSDVEIACARPDARPAIWMRDVANIDIDGLRALSATQASLFVARNVSGLTISDSHGLAMPPRRVEVAKR